MKLVINTDGGARGNPGPAGIGVVIRGADNQIIGEYKQYIGAATNNVAEYKALIFALQKAQEISNFKFQISNKPSPSVYAKASADRLTPLILGEGNGFTELEIRMDSELIVRQMQGRYKIKEPTLKLLAAEVLKLRNQFKNVIFRHVPREQNKEADKLVNEAIDDAAI